MSETNETTTAETPTKRDPFIELHQHRQHSVEWRFSATLPVSLPDGDRYRESLIIGKTCEAVEASPLVDKLIKGVDTLLPGKVSRQISMIGVRLTTTSKKDFDLANVFARTVLADVDLSAFAAEIKADTEARLAKHDKNVEAEKRAEHLIGVALSARGQVHRMAEEKADEAFADELDGLRVRYNQLVEKYVERCQQEAARILSDVGEFAALGDDDNDVQAVFDLTNEITAEQPLKFRGPTIHPPHFVGAYGDPNKVDYTKHLRRKAALIVKLGGESPLPKLGMEDK
jgi:hypothetical protein